MIYRYSIIDILGLFCSYFATVSFTRPFKYARFLIPCFLASISSEPFLIPLSEVTSGSITSYPDCCLLVTVREPFKFLTLLTNFWLLTDFPSRVSPGPRSL